jgi:CubicO group peptidase (beta-lactamase class C family)
MHIILFSFLLLISCDKQTSKDTPSLTIEPLTEIYKLPALASAMFDNGKMTQLNVDGVRVFGQIHPAQLNDAFHLGSCTKAMTSTLAAILIEEGKLNWNSPLSDLLPDYDLNPLFADLSFDLLLVHRTGITPSHHELFTRVRSMDPTAGRDLISRTLLKVSPEITPGQRYNYSNFNYIIAGHILEKLTGESWEQLIREKIFIPLNMRTCGFGVTPLIRGHARINGKITPLISDNPMAFGPASTIHCSLSDWGKFLDVHLRGFNGESNVVSADNFKKLHSAHPAQDNAYTYGGWLLQQRTWAQGPALTHDGSNTMNYAKVWIAPKINKVMMSATNIAGKDAENAVEKVFQNMLLDR